LDNVSHNGKKKAQSKDFHMKENATVCDTRTESRSSGDQEKWRQTACIREKRMIAGDPEFPACSGVHVIWILQRQCGALLAITWIILPRKLVANILNLLWEHIITIAMILCKYNHSSLFEKQLFCTLCDVPLCPTF
jgi:hypothetical protein